MATEHLLELLLSGISLGSIYAMVALGIMLVWSVSRVLNLAAGEFVMLGGMLSATFYGLGLPLPLAAIMAIIVTTAIGALIWRVFLHSLVVKGASPLTIKLLTLALALMISGGAFLIWGPFPKSLPYFTDISIKIGGAYISPQAPWIWATLFIIIVGLSFLFNRTLLGKGLRGSAEQPIAARLMSINPHSMAFLSYVIAAGLGALAGVVLTPLIMAHHAMGLELTIMGLLSAYVGGVTSAPGAIIGGLILGVAEDLSSGYVSGEFGRVFALGTLLVILLLRPQGIMGTKELEV